MNGHHSKTVKGCMLAACFALAAFAQSPTSPYIPGFTFQSFNPNYPKPNPFYFEGKIDWEKLNISQPANTWEFMQRGIHKQDDLGDLDGAISDYKQSLALNSLTGGTCQLVTSATLLGPDLLPPTLNPAPCMFTVRLRLAYLLRATDPATAISLYQEVLQIDPLRPDASSLMGEAYVIQGDQAQNADDQAAAYQNAINAFQAELALNPVTAQYTALTGDQANSAHVHWSLAELYQKLGRNADAVSELKLYLLATQWHSDVYPWRIMLAQKKIQALSGSSSAN
jgi:tetratricopeptide (TPR) repeat protein